MVCDGREEKLKSRRLCSRRSQGRGPSMSLPRPQLTSLVPVPRGWPQFQFVSPDPLYHVWNIIDPGDDRLDENFGVILDFLDGHSFNVEEKRPKPQESAQESTMHFSSQMFFLSLRTKGTTHSKLLVSKKTPRTLLPNTLSDVDKNEFRFLPWLSFAQSQRQFIIQKH